MARILIIDDNEMNIDILIRTLARDGHELLTARDGESGLVIARRELPDIVLLDISLPGIDGREVARRLRAAPATQEIAILALTAHAMAGDRELCLAAGCDDYESKPLDLGRVVAKIARLLARGARPAPRETRRSGDE